MQESQVAGLDELQSIWGGDWPTVGVKRLFFRPMSSSLRKLRAESWVGPGKRIGPDMKQLIVQNMEGTRT